METNTHQFGSIARPQAAEPNRVLRNTYALLGLSMVPTAIGAAIGTTLLAPLMFSLGMGISAIVFLVVAFGMMWAIQKNRDSGLGVALLLGFTFFMGLWLGPLLSVALQFRNGGQLIAMAAGGTGAIFFTLAGIASTTKRDFSNMGKFLMIGLVLIVVAFARQYLLPDPGPVAGDFWRGGAAVLGLHPVRHQPYRARRRNQLRQRHPGCVSEHLQPVHQPAAPADGLCRRSRLSEHRSTSIKTGAEAPVFILSVRSRPFEQRDRFDVRGLREHVGNTRPLEHITLFVHQDGSIARQRGRAA